MQSAKRVTLVPPEQDGGSVDFIPESGSYVGEPVRSEKTDKIKFKIYDKIHRFIKIILKLAKSESYDEGLRIKSRNGKFLEKSNIVDLLTHAMSAGKVLHGEEEFIGLLAECGVDPELILNENVKSKLEQYMNKNSSIRRIAFKPTQTVERNPSERTDKIRDTPKVVRKGNKKVILVDTPEDQEETFEEPTQSFKRKIDEYDADDEEEVTQIPAPKRKRVEINLDDDSVDDEMIDNSRWKI